MSTRTATAPLLAPFVALPRVAVTPLFFAVMISVAAGSIVLMGLWAVALPVYLAMIVLAVAFPTRAAYALLIGGIIIEPGAVDFMKPISAAIWSMPPGFENAVGITTSPMELLVVASAASALLTRRRSVSLPLITWAVPAVIFLGMVYGLSKGAPANLTYNEARGPLIAVAMFVLALHSLPRDPARLARPIMVATGILSVLILVRYFALVRTGSLTVPAEFAFSHESSILLGIGLLLGATAAVRRGTDVKSTLFLMLYCGLVLAAMIASGRRAATLVLLVGGASMAFLLLPRRPQLVIFGSLALLLAGGAYLGMYWNKEFGAAAQPARAIRSQFDPSLRDESSDLYRTIEKQDVIETIRVNRVFGVGFGRPFIQFQPLPDLTTFWPLQAYTPHQNVLWLWLKMGVVGISVVLGFIVVVLQRAVHLLRSARDEREWAAGAVIFSTVAMFLVYATVDLGFVGARSLGPVVISAAAVFLISHSRPEATRVG